MSDEKDPTLEERVDHLESELSQLREELAEWFTYASSLNQKLERLTSTISAMQPDWANALGRNGLAQADRP